MRQILCCILASFPIKAALWVWHLITNSNDNKAFLSSSFLIEIPKQKKLMGKVPQLAMINPDTSMVPLCYKQKGRLILQKNWTWGFKEGNLRGKRSSLHLCTCKSPSTAVQQCVAKGTITKAKATTSHTQRPNAYSHPAALKAKIDNNINTLHVCQKWWRETVRKTLNLQLFIGR